MTSTATRIIINIRSCIASTRRSGCSGGSGASGAGVGPCASGGGSSRGNKTTNMIAYICIRIDISINIRISMHHLWYLNPGRNPSPHPPTNVDSRFTSEM